MEIKRILINCINTVSNSTRKKVDYLSKEMPIYYLDINEISHIASSNNIITFDYNGNQLFFKECRKHFDSRTYINFVLNDYFDVVSTYEGSSEIKSIVCQDLLNNHCFKDFWNLDVFCAQNYSVISYYNGWDTNVIGLPSLNKRNSVVIKRFMENYFPKFLEYVRNEIDLYKMNSFIKAGEYQVFRSSMSVATSKMSNLFKITEMVPNLWYAKIRIDGQPEKMGIVSERAAGRCPLELSLSKKQNISPEFQRQLVIMNLFDTICFQRDHKEENYFVIYDRNETAKRVVAFDNDSPMTFFPIPIISIETSIKCSPISIHGRINRPYLDDEFVGILFNIKYSDIKNALREDLSLVQIAATWYRILLLKRAIVKSQGKECRCISTSEWNIETIKKEIDGSYGKTYLKHYLECDENALVSEIMNN